MLLIPTKVVPSGFLSAEQLQKAWYIEQAYRADHLDRAHRATL